MTALNSKNVYFYFLAETLKYPKDVNFNIVNLSYYYLVKMLPFREFVDQNIESVIKYLLDFSTKACWLKTGKRQFYPGDVIMIKNIPYLIINKNTNNIPRKKIIVTLDNYKKQLGILQLEGVINNES